MGLFLGYFSKRLLVGLAGKGAQGAIFIGRGAIIKVIGICSIEGGCVVFIHGRSLILDSLAPFGFEGSPETDNNQGNDIATYN